MATLGFPTFSKTKFDLFRTSLYLWIWIGLVSTVMATVSEYTDGLQELEILLERKEFWPKIWKLFVDKTLARFKGQAPEQKED